MPIIRCTKIRLAGGRALLGPAGEASALPRNPWGGEGQKRREGKGKRERRKGEGKAREGLWTSASLNFSEALAYTLCFKKGGVEILQ